MSLRCRFYTLLAATLLTGYLAGAEPVSVTLLVTTDLHGNILPYDYFTAKPAERGLAKVATLIREELGIEVKGTEIEIEASLNPAKFAGTDRSVRAGYQAFNNKITARVCDDDAVYKFELLRTEDALQTKTNVRHGRAGVTVYGAAFH